MHVGVRLQVVAAQLHAAHHLGHALVVRAPRLAVREHERDVRVVRARDVVVDERVRVGVADPDALVEAELVRERRRPAADQAAGVGLQRAVGRVHAHLDRRQVSDHALGLRHALPVRGEQRHRLDQPLDAEVLARIVGVREAQPVDELRDRVLDLDARVHLHEEEVEARDDTLERRHRVEPGRRAEFLALGLHAGQVGAIADQRLARLPARAADLDVEQLLRERYLDELLLVHLHRAIAAAEGDTPIAVADQLDLVVARALDVELDEEVPVRARLDHLGLGAHVHDGGRDLVGLGDHALALAAAAADVLEADAVCRVVAPDRGADLLGLLLQLRDAHELHALGEARLQERLRVRLERVAGPEGVREVVLPGGFLEALAVLHPCEQRACAHVVDAGDDGVAEAARELLGLVLRTGAAQHVRRRPHEADARALDRLHQLRVLGHEAVAGEDVRVAAISRDRHDLADALLPLLLTRSGVVRHSVHVLREAERAQLGREAARVDDGVLLGEQHPVLAHPYLVENLERLQPHRAPAHDQHLQGFQGERAQPRALALGEAARHEIAVEHHSNSRCGPLIGDGVYVRIRNARCSPSTRRLVPGMTMRDTEPSESASFGFMSSRS